jgi:hypothetical protein
MGDFGWQGLRRDVLAGLVGAAVAAGVLVPVGWSRVKAEQRQADRLRREVLEWEDSHRAETSAKVAERDR